MAGRGRRPVRIANCSGAMSDQGVNMLRQIESGPVDIVTGDYLAGELHAYLGSVRLLTPNENSHFRPMPRHIPQAHTPASSPLPGMVSSRVWKLFRPKESKSSSTAAP